MAPSWQSLVQKEKVILKFHLRNGIALADLGDT